MRALSVEELAARWKVGCERAIREALERPANETEYDKALAFASSNIRKVARSDKGQACITLSQALTRQAGLQRGDRVLVLPLAEGGFLVRRATGEEIVEAHRLYAVNPPPTFSRVGPSSQLNHLERVCRQCGKLYCASGTRQLFCDGCGRDRRRAWSRVYWHRKGKLTPSYRRKLKRAELAGACDGRQGKSPSLPFVDETHGEAGTTQRAAGSPPSHAAAFASPSVAVPLESAR
jgi:hypothetical protein